MCFNISVAKEKEVLEQRFNATFESNVEFEPNYFLTAFTKPFVPVITNDNREKIQLFKWGLIPHWIKTAEQAKDISKKTFNARVETAKDKPSFRDAMRSNHCLVLVDGFFEWKTEKNKKIPHYIYLDENNLIAFAGLWNEWVNKETGEIQSTFTILTQDANPFMASIHNTKKRQPIILNPDLEEAWLSAGSDTQEFENHGLKIDMKAHTISKDFRTIGNNVETIREVTAY